MDVLIVLAGALRPGEEITRYGELVSGICLRHDLLISTVPAAEDQFAQQTEPLYESVVREGALV